MEYSSAQREWHFVHYISAQLEAQNLMFDREQDMKIQMRSMNLMETEMMFVEKLKEMVV